MSTRERWIVYPLLFLTLGIALRDKIVPATMIEAERVRCDRLEVDGLRCGRLESEEADCRHVKIIGPGDRELMYFGRATNGMGRLEVRGADGKTAVAVGTDPSGRSGVVETLAQGVPQVQLRSTAQGGAIAVVDRGGSTSRVWGAGLAPQRPPSFLDRLKEAVRDWLRQVQRWPDT